MAYVNNKDFLIVNIVVCVQEVFWLSARKSMGRFG